MAELKVNGKVHQVNAEEDTPLLWAIGLPWFNWY